MSARGAARVRGAAGAAGRSDGGPRGVKTFGAGPGGSKTPGTGAPGIETPGTGPGDPGVLGTKTPGTGPGATVLRAVGLVVGLVVAIWVLLAAGPAAGGDAAAINLDGSFPDWRGIGTAAVDPAGDGRAGGPDLGRLYLANDSEALYLRLEVGSETILQNPLLSPAGNRLRLLLDLDRSATSGWPVEGLGVELEIRFGEREITIYDAGGVGREVPPEPADVLALPTHSAANFEIRVPFAAAGSIDLAERLAAGGELALVLLEEAIGGDRLPDAGAVVYRVEPAAIGPPRPIPLGKKKAAFVRLLVFNVERTAIAQKQAVYRRILQALEPDVVAFQEVYDWTPAQTRLFVETALPLDGGRWEAFGVADTVTVSSLPILAGAAVDENHVVHLDLPDGRTKRDLVLFNAHTPCCGNEEGRDAEHDHLMATWRDLLESAGPFPVGSKDAVVLAGDFNMVGFRRQLDVLRHGRFIDPANGPDFRPGRGKGSLRSASLRHSHARRVTTWRRATSAFMPGKLDWILFSNDVAKLRKSYVLDTAELPAKLLEDLGLERGDSLVASDHLALVADFKIKR